MNKTTAKKPAKNTKTTAKKDDLDQVYSILHKSKEYKEMVKAGKVPTIRNGVRIG